MRRLFPVAAAYRKVLGEAVVVQALAFGFAPLLLDGGTVLSLCVVAAAVFWPSAVLILVRRPQNPTSADLALIRFGFLALVGLILLSLMVLGALLGH